MGRVGVLALQGGWAAHVRALVALGHTACEVRTAADLDSGLDGDLDGGLDGLILPGGESSTQLLLLERHDLAGALDRFARSGRPLLATCAGLILAARTVAHPAQKSFGWIDVAVTRNGWGGQLDSFEAIADGPGDGGVPLIFIRAPRVTAVGAAASVLATLDGEPIFLRQGQIFGATFHPELTGDLRIHRAVFGGAA